jgi:hypothetical protein
MLTVEIAAAGSAAADIEGANLDNPIINRYQFEGPPDIV